MRRLAFLLLFFFFLAAGQAWAEQYKYDDPFGPGIADNRKPIKFICNSKRPHRHIIFLYDPDHEVELVVVMAQELDPGNWRIRRYVYFYKKDFFFMSLDQGGYVRLNLPAHFIEMLKADIKARIRQYKQLQHEKYKKGT